MNNNFGALRAIVYASINGKKGNMIKLRDSTILSKAEKEKAQNVIDALGELRVEFYQNRGQKNCYDNRKRINRVGV